jgi:hypothetical protein
MKIKKGMMGGKEPSGRDDKVKLQGGSCKMAT